MGGERASAGIVRAQGKPSTRRDAVYRIPRNAVEVAV